MAVVRIPDENRVLREQDQVRDYLASISIDYERWEPVTGVGADASSQEILRAYEGQVSELKRRGGYVTADVIDVKPATPGLGPLFAKCNIDHRPADDQIPYIIPK